MTDSSQGPIPINFRRVLVRPDELPKPLSRLLWNRVGDQILLEFGHFDTAELRIALDKYRAQDKKPDSGVECNFYVTARYMMPPTAIPDLVSDVTGLLADLKKEGILSRVQAKRAD